MPAYLIKNKDEILRSALQKLSEKTQITATSPGSVARAMAEVIIEEIGDLYSVLDFNMASSFVSTAQGRALDQLGLLYNVTRKTLADVAAIDKSLGSFYFYLDTP